MTPLTTLFMTKKLQAEFKNSDLETEIEELKTKIKDLESQLAEANDVAEFYGKKSHWMDSRISPDDVELMSTEMNDPGGKRARQYLEKYKEGKP